MPRPPKLNTLQDLIHYFLSHYYIMRERNQGIRYDHKRHYSKTLTIEKNYHLELERRYPQWNAEEARRELRVNIDFLTGVFTQQEKLEAGKGNSGLSSVATLRSSAFNN